MVLYLCGVYRVSERHACDVVLLPRATHRYQSIRDPLTELRLRMRALAQARIRYGYRKIRVLLIREGWQVGKKLVYRLYREEGLGLRARPKARRTVSEHCRQKPRAEGPNHVWSLDFVADQFTDGRRFRALTVVDVYTRECLLGSQPTLSRWENAPSARDLVRLNDALLEIFIRVCGEQVRERGQILLDIDSTDDPTYGQQQLSFFNGAYGQHMYHPMLVFERHTGCLLAARLRAGNASSHARIVPMLLRLGPRLQSAFPGVQIKLRGDAGFALPLLYEFCEFFGIEYALGIPANCVFQRRAEPRQKQLKRRYRRTQLPQRGFSSFRHRARSWPRQRRICYKAEHTAAGTNLRFLITNCTGRASQVFAFYNDRGECENRIEEFKNGFRADRLSCHRFLANALRLLLHGAAYNLVNFFRHQLPQPWRSAQIETLRARLFKLGARVRQTARAIRIHLATGWPFQGLFCSVAVAVNSS